MTRAANGPSPYADWTYEPQADPGFHLSDHDLERYYLGMVQRDFELAIIEEHLLTCSECIDRAEETAEGVDTIRSAIISGAFDLA